jgi:hypothetical protein
MLIYLGVFIYRGGDFVVSHEKFHGGARRRDVIRTLTKKNTDWIY